nr:MAG TPA: hypothetical protein [Caudoviricetes sp.]
MCYNNNVWDTHFSERNILSPLVLDKRILLFSFFMV